MTRIAVVGAGVVGLSTACSVLETIPNVQVTVLADKFSPDTTSNVAAGIFRPGSSFNGPSYDITLEWLKTSFAYLKTMVNQYPEVAKEAGIIPLSGYLLATENREFVEIDYLRDTLDVYRPCTDEELKLYEGNYKYGTYFETYLIDNNYYMPYLENKIKSLGGTLELRNVSDLRELSDYDVICNCSGLGARVVCKDKKVVPIRGQVIKVNAPWVKHVLYVDYETYIIPKVDEVTLGGTWQFKSWKTDVDKYDSMAIWERCLKVIPSLKDAKVIKESVGFRPYRPEVRVEKEVIDLSQDKKLKVVHNYGHGGYGVMSSYGTGIQAVRLVQQLLSESLQAKL